MKRLVIIYIVLIIVVILLALLQRGSIMNFFGSKGTATINGKTYKLDLAKTPKQRSDGLSNRSKLDSDRGMLFILDQKGIPTFWMKDMKFAIDIIFINDNKIVYIVNSAPPPTEGMSLADLPTYTPTQEANYVLEVNAGEAVKNNFKPGDTVELKDIK